jgi:hypothetical protein
MSEASAGTQAQARTETHAVPLTELQQWAIRYKTVIAAGTGSSISAFLGYVSLFPLAFEIVADN